MTLAPSPARFARIALAFLSLAALSCSGDNGPTVIPPALTTIKVTLANASIAQGQTVAATAAGADQNGAAFAVGTMTWSSSATDIASVGADGSVKGLKAGTSQIIATAGTISGSQTITVNAPAGIKINEIESNGGTPGDWAELYNPTSAPVDISGWIVKDNDDTHIYTIPAGTTIAAGGYFLAEEAGFGFGLGAPDAVRLYSPFAVLVDSYDWTAHATTTYGRCPNGTGAFTTTTSSTKGAANDCSNPVKINEVESNGGTPGDWIELFNPGVNTIDMSGYVVKDNDDTHSYTIPAGTTIAAGAYLVLEEAQFVFGLGQPDAARIFTPTGALLDSYSWDTHATTTYGRCPNGSGAFVTTVASTKGAANSCPTSGPSIATWPGDDNVVTIDGNAVFGGNLSGLAYEAAAGSSPAVLWGARNGIGTLFRLVFNGTIWTPDATNGWTAGKAVKYPDGTGDPDFEGVTFAAGGSVGGIYASTERNNSNNSVSKNSILRFDPNQAGATLTATNEWNLTADLPVTGANLGIEGITWVPDTFLVAQKFFDENANHTYVPSEYANHGTGIFFVGLEANGIIYAYALDHTANTFKRVATFSTGFPAGVMDLWFDRELGLLWAVCDDGCGGNLGVFEIDAKAGSATLGRFQQTHLFARPTSMPNLNNEGFTIAPLAECVNGKRNAYWSDDSETGGHAIRRASITCVKF